jgi:hypothetical protein
MIFKKKTKLDRQINPYLQAGGRRFESDYLHKKGAAPMMALPLFLRRCPAVALPGASLFIEGHAPQTLQLCGLSASGLHLGAAFAMIRERRKD